MQKLEFTNGNGVSIDLTDHVNFGVTKWSGLSEVGVEVQTQQVPFADGVVYLDNLLSQREINVTVAIQDNGDLERRYELQRKLIECLNPKLGEGVLTYTNDYLSKQIKALPQVPIFPNKNSNESGTLKGSVTFTCCNPLWEDKKESIIPVGKGVTSIVNSGDVPTSIKLEIFTSSAENLKITNLKNNKVLQFSETLTKDVNINTELGGKRVTSQQLKWKSENTNDLNSICYSAELGLFVAVGNGGTIITSVNVKDWTRQISGVTNDLYSVIYSSDLNLFVAVGYVGTILTSNDGINWTNQTSGTTNSLRSICYSSNLNLFVAVGDSGKVLTSPDGINWTNRTVTPYQLLSICYSSELNLFVAVGGSGEVLTSNNGTNWTFRTSGVTTNLRSVCYSPELGLFVAVGTNGKVLTSTDGINWISSEVTNILFSVCYSSELSLFVIVGNNGIILTSNNGTNWTRQTSGVSISLSSVCYSSELELFVIVGDSGFILTSPDGINWTSRTSGVTSWLRSICYSSELSLFVIVGNNGIILTSNNGTNWTSQTSNVTTTLRSVCYSQELGLFVAVGDSGEVLTSNNGTNWTFRTSGVTNDLYSVCYSPELGLFVAVGGATYGIIINSYFSEVENLISELTPNSNMTFNLEVGENQILISAKGRLNGRISFRNKYIGV